MRLVVDPGVFVSALITPGGSPGRLVRLWLGGDFEAIASPHLIAELREVVLRDKFRAWFSLDVAEAYVKLIAASAILVDDPAPDPSLAPDPDDAYLVALAHTGRVAALVTGDRALLKPGRLGVPTLTPAQALEVLAAAL